MEYSFLDIFVQIMIVVPGLLAIWLTQQEYKKNWKRYACIFGLISQPFFLYSTYHNHQIGMFILSIFYTYIWFIGFKNNWLFTNGRY